MTREELQELQDKAYENILDGIANGDDPEVIAQLANAAAQLEKGRNDALKIENDIEINKIKLVEEKKNHDKDLEIEEKQRKFDKKWKIFDSVIAVAGMACGILLAFKTKSEEEESYPKQPKTDQKAERLFEKTFKKR